MGSSPFTPAATSAGEAAITIVDLPTALDYGVWPFLIGDAAYRFEHDGDRYRISTVAKARGLAALLVAYLRLLGTAA